MGDNPKKEIIIDLSKSSNAQSYMNADLIHAREFDRINEIVCSRLERLSLKKKGSKEETESSQWDKSRLNDAISILGSRGSGKTSFMLSVLENYSKHDDIQIIPKIDPTLIEEKGHIFLVVISLIQKCVQDKLNACDCNPHSEMFHKKAEWKELLHKLSAGLPTLDGIGGHSLNESSWQDPEFVMDKGLKAVQASYDLESNFNKLLSLALEILCKKAFMIALDDIDVDFKKGWPLLESLRKYLTSPRLIVLVSGDLQLFSKAIRKQQWKNFGKALLKNETEPYSESDQNAKDKKRVMGELVTEMESQYLQKVLKPENRINLTTLYDKIYLYDYNVSIKITEEKSLEAKEFYNTALQLLGIYNKYQGESYRSHLLTLPIRTQIQFMKIFEKLDKDSNMVMNDKMDFTSPFLSDLYEEEVDIQLATTLPKMLNVVILKLLLKEQNLDEAYQLQPTTSKLSFNNSLFALSALFSKHVRNNPFLIFDFMIKIGYIRNLHTILDYHEIADSTYSKPTVEGLCRHSGILQDKVLRDILGNINAYMESNAVNKSNTKTKVELKNNDIIQLYGSALRNKGTVASAEQRIDYVFSTKTEGMNQQIQTLAFIPISTSSYLHYKSSSTVYSIYTLMATIGELIRKYEINDLDNGFKELSQWRTYPMIAFDKGYSNFSDREDYPGVEIKSDDSGNTIIKELFSHWCQKYKDETKKVGVCSPHLLGKIITRIYYTVNTIANNNKSNTNLGVAMHRRVVALLNAILIEDIREHSTNTEKLNISNAVTSDKLFLDNISFALELLKEHKPDLSISKWLLSCPLFLVYLDKGIIDNSNFIEYTGTENIDSIKASNIYELLCRVEPKEQDSQGNKTITELVTNRENATETDKPRFNSQREEERKKVINTLIDNNIPYSLFVQAENKKTQMENNSQIRELCRNLFQETIFDSDKLKNLRDYISDNKDTLEDIIRWRQAQS